MTTTQPDIKELCELFDTRVSLDFGGGRLASRDNESWSDTTRTIAEVCRLCQGGIRISYDSKDQLWWLNLEDTYIVLETRSTCTYSDGRKEHLLAGSKLHVSGKTFQEAVAQLRKNTVECKGFLLSNQSFGGFGSMDEYDTVHMITPVKDGLALEPFRYHEGKVRSLLRSYAAEQDQLDR